MKKIIFEKNGEFGIVIPNPGFVQQLLDENPTWTEEEAVRHIGDKDLQTGVKFSVVTEDELKTIFGETADGLVDDTFYSAWEYIADENSLTSQDLSQEYLDKYNMTGQYDG